MNQCNLESAFGKDATEENRVRWLAAFEEENKLPVLQNGDTVTCSFGMSKPGDKGFWKYRAKLQVTIEYYGWFGYHYKETQNIHIVDSNSFTGFQWASGS